MLPGQRSTSAKFENPLTDASDKEAQWRSGTTCGTRTVSVSCAGVVRDDVSPAFMNYILTSYMMGDTVSVRVADTGLQDAYEMTCLPTVAKRSGEHNGAEMFSYTLESAGAVVHVSLIPPVVDGDMWAIPSWSMSPGVSTTIGRAPQRVVAPWSIL